MEKTKIIINRKRFEGKVAILTASTQGIGFSIAERLGLEGASLVVSSRNKKNVEEAVEKLKGHGINEVVGVVCHVSNAQQRRNLIEKALQKYGKIDVVVSNAAVNPITNYIKDSSLKIDDSVLEKLWDVNVKACVLFLKEVAPHLKKDSSIILISSVSAFQTLRPNWAMYGVTKTALIGLTKALAVELAPDIRVNCIAPGVVPTSFARIITNDASIMNDVMDASLLKRLGKSEEIAAATAFMASDEASYITGETLVVAGGLPSRL